MHGLHGQGRLKAEVELPAVPPPEPEGLLLGRWDLETLSKSGLQCRLPGVVSWSGAWQQTDLLGRHVQVARRQKSPVLAWFGLKAICLG
jgi:hypothetical protein